MPESYDLPLRAKRDRELKVSGKIERAAVSPAGTDRQPEEETEVAPEVQLRKITLKKNEPVTAEHIDLDQLMTAQHLWTRGLPIAEIAAETRLDEAVAAECHYSETGERSDHDSPTFSRTSARRYPEVEQPALRA